ncbi:MAG: hypothetical protein K2N78_12800, partial [Oscillospiraceae bacterium]|nr:hypothetical protein [Oscillospiraceae bacterium]
FFAARLMSRPPTRQTDNSIRVSMVLIPRFSLEISNDAYYSIPKNNAQGVLLKKLYKKTAENPDKSCRNVCGND